MERLLRGSKGHAYPVRRGNPIMHDLLPEGEELRRAVRWIAGHLQESPEQPVPPLVREAIFKFDLSPRDAEFLIGFYRRPAEKP